MAAEEQSTEENRPRTSWGRLLLQAVLALLVLGAGVAVAVIFIRLRKPPERVEQEVPAPLVQVSLLEARDIPMIVRGYGTVAPKVEVDLVSQVPGRVVFVHSDLKAGGVIPAGERILQIDPSDYELAVRQARAAVAETQVRLDTQTAEADVARREWRQLSPDAEPTSPLVFREPQVRQAQAALESAEAALATAELQLQRTVLSLPFDVMIASESVDLGQYVGVGQVLAEAYGVDTFEIVVPLEDEELAWIDVFGKRLAADGGATQTRRIPADVQAGFAGGEHTWQGYLVRTTGQVDPVSRMVPVVIEVPEPLDTEDKPPLLPGAFVEVAITGRTLEEAIAVPRDAIHGGKRIWLVEDGQLRIQQVDFVRADEEFAYVTEGMPDSALIVTSALDAVVEGMAVRTPAGAADTEPEAVSAAEAVE